MRRNKVNYEPVFHRVAELAARLGKPILVYDLEATTFRGQSNFGITEVSCYLVHPEGPALAFGSLVNPERSISPEASRLTGITQAMVAKEEHWGVRYAKTFRQFAEGSCYVTGFNNSTFDNHAVKDMGERYGEPFESFVHTFDVRRLHLKLTQAKTSGGNLLEVAELYGLKPSGDLHRAEADTVLTLELLNAIIETFGVEAVAALIEDKPTGATDKLSAAAIAKYVRSRERMTVEDLAKAFKKSSRDVSFELGKALDDRLVAPQVFACQTTQEWLAQTLPELPEQLLAQGKLKPLLDACMARSAPKQLDYIQLRIGLLEAGLSWGTLKQP